MRRTLFIAAAIFGAVSVAYSAYNGTGPFSVGGQAATGAALVGNPVLVGGSDGTDVRNISTDGSGRPVVVGPGTAGSASGGVLTVQGASSMTPVLVTPSAPADPCFASTKSNAAISTSGGTNVQAVAGSASKKVYICSLSLVAGATAAFNVIEGTGSACTTSNEAAVIGSTTAANGMPFAANGGMTLGSGTGTIGVTATAANGICILASSSVAFAGNMTYIQQ